jgi:hypothetical protein
MLVALLNGHHFSILRPLKSAKSVGVVVVQISHQISIRPDPMNSKKPIPRYRNVC